MKAIFLSGSQVGTKTITSMSSLLEEFKQTYPKIEAELLDLKKLQIDFSDGRNYLDYDQDTLHVTKKLMEADIIFIGSPTFQASIPGSLKNVFDLLPQKAFERKTVGIIMTAGSPKHYLVGETQLKPILNYMKANIVPRYVFIEDRDIINQEIINPEVQMRLTQLLEDTVVLAQTYENVWQTTEDKYDF
ncbi:NADPH-dependent FMN reductase [Vagococcus silagei]|uniref:NAD(P)H-dependent oxidoreductase n=1 Tax=Vagococcus silagei TaxID=2508885 RepID=A0A4S3AZI1_9ENTE|nr:NADPH-dependent FMN reductase [Vagococcus silagei]THB60204.1 NAD(P)H-dependent oxidoreductase [Vagococcus silagei]